MPQVSSSSLLFDALQNQLSHLWNSVWNDFIAHSLAQHTLTHLDLCHGTLGTPVLLLDDPIKRSLIVPCDDISWAACTDALLHDSIRTKLNESLTSSGGRKQSRSQLRRTLLEHGVVPDLVQSPKSAEHILNYYLPCVWRTTARLLAQQINITEQGEAPEDEPTLHSQLLLARLLHTCRLGTAKQLRDHINSLMCGLHGPRSGLIAIVERIGVDGIVDSHPPTIATRTSPMSAMAEPITDLLRICITEDRKILDGNGLLHRVLGTGQPVPIPAKLGGPGIVTQAKLSTYRSRIHTQYESTLLCYGVLSAYEQLLRSVAAHAGVDHLKKQGYPAPAMDWATREAMTLPPKIVDDIKSLYAPDGANIRNRVMHSGLLETRSKSLDVILSIPNPELLLDEVDISQDSLVPENILAVCIEKLSRLEHHTATLGLTKTDLAWTANIWLSQEERDFGLSIRCDVLEDENAARQWHARLGEFVRASLPTFSIYWQLAWMGWLGHHSTTDRLPLFLAWGILFEGLYRVALQVFGFDVLQRSRKGNGVRMFQYRTLDCRQSGLCRQEILDALTEPVRPEERGNACRTVLLAAKLRNALAHGAITTHSHENHRAAGHIFIKTIQLLMAATEHRMTRIGAYYEYLRTRGSAPADPARDWRLAEGRVLAMIHDVAAAQIKLRES